MLRKMEPGDAKSVSKIHKGALGIGFLSELGEEFLEIVYEGISKSQWGVGYVYTVDSKIVGFITGSKDTTKLMKNIYLKKYHPLGKKIFLKTLRKPSNIKNIFQYVRYPGLTQDKVRAELLSIAVLDSFRGKGIGRELVNALIDYFKINDIYKFIVSVDQRLPGADEFYKTMGFEFNRTMNVSDRRLNLYNYELNGGIETTLSPYHKIITESRFYDNNDWNKYWEHEVGEKAAIQKITGRFRKYFGDEYFNQIYKIISANKVRILEVGCGTAYTSHRLATAGYDTFALDYSPQAKKFWDRKQTNFFIADGFHIPFRSDSFELVWNAGVLEHFSNPQQMLNEMIRVCKPDGIVCVFVPYIFDFTAHLKLYGEENIFTKDKLKNELRELDDIGIKVLYKCGGMIICGWGKKKG